MVFIYIVDIILISIANIFLIKNRNIGTKEPETWAGIIIYLFVCILFSLFFRKFIEKYLKTNIVKTILLILLISIIFISLIIYMIILYDIKNIYEIFTDWINHDIITNGLFIVLIFINSIIMLFCNAKCIIKNKQKSN
jgi:hypothetical protein